MEINQDVHTEPIVGCYRCSRRSSWWSILLKVILALFALGMVFLGGLCCGLAISRLHPRMGGNLYQQEARPFGTTMFRAPMHEQEWDFEKRLFRREEVREDRELKNTTSTVQFFGSITRIEGGRITILNNGAQEQAILSQADTVISAQGKAVGISQIVVGQTMSGAGTANADGSIAAKVIWIML